MINRGINDIVHNLVHEKLSRRILTSFIVFHLLFLITVILSYLVLPEGFLKSKNSVLDFKTSSNLWLQALQILGYNCFSMLLLIFANFFATSKFNNVYLPYGYLGLSVQFILNGITLGTWSFTAVSESAPVLFARILRTYDIFHRAGIWEMTGQLFIVTALANIAIVKVKNKEVTRKRFRDVKPSTKEIGIAFLGLVFMILGAIIESSAIILE